MNYITLLTGTGAGTIPMIAIWVVMIAFMYFILIRPQRKRQKELQALQNSIEVGDTVVLNSGIYGKIVDKNGHIVVIELGLNKSVRVPVEKSYILNKVDPDFMRAEEESKDEKPKAEKKSEDKKEEK